MGYTRRKGAQHSPNTILAGAEDSYAKLMSDAGQVRESTRILGIIRTAVIAHGVSPALLPHDFLG